MSNNILIKPDDQINDNSERHDVKSHSISSDLDISSHDSISYNKNDGNTKGDEKEDMETKFVDGKDNTSALFTKVLFNCKNNCYIYFDKNGL
ncbi:MAG: hypothetical protein L0H53_09740 [Candidatus Nitrosocosmicus sp.]|nr:hypothetical protein [Candidatus Nitrosocosmicus sp.]